MSVTPTLSITSSQGILMTHTDSALRSLLRQAVLVLLCLSVSPSQSSFANRLDNRVDSRAKPRWHTATLIETDAGYACWPQVAMDAAGNAIVVWHQSDGTHYNIWSNRYEAGKGWGTAELIETDDIGDAKFAQIAVDRAGNAIAVWHQSDGTGGYNSWNIWANRYEAGTGWGTAQLIETDNAGGAAGPNVAMDAAGNAIAVWHQSDGTRYNIWANRYETGKGWGTAELIETDNAGDAYAPHVAVDTAGNAVTVWQEAWNIWSNRYEAGKGWGTAKLIGTSAFIPPHVAMDAIGNAVTVWSLADSIHLHIGANRYEAGKGWGKTRLIETNNTENAWEPRIAMDAAGNAVAVWYQYDGTYSHSWTNRYVAGKGWGKAKLLIKAVAGYPNVTMNAAGNAIAVWQQPDGNNRDNIWAKHYEAGKGWGRAKLIKANKVDYAFAGEPQIAMNPTGNAIAVWEQIDSTNGRGNIWSALYK